MRRVSPGLREEILNKYNYTCVYCGDLANTVDHVIPFEYIHSWDPENVVAACFDCNSMARDLVFESFEKKTAFIRERRKSKKWQRKFRNRVSVCIDCNSHFRQRVNGSIIFLCSWCAMLADLKPEEREKYILTHPIQENDSFPKSK